MKSIEVKNLKKQFKTTEAVKGIDFSINQSETLALLGPNGCGKTTTIGMLLGLITPTSGNIFINEEELNYKDHQFLNIMNFASPYVELPKKLTVLENLKVYGRMYLIKNFKEKDYILAEKNFENALSLAPKRFSILDNLASIYFINSKFEKCLAIIDDLFELNFKEKKIIHLRNSCI